MKHCRCGFGFGDIYIDVEYVEFINRTYLI